MGRKGIVLTLVLILVNSMHLIPISATVQEDNLVLTIYGNGLVKVNYAMVANPMDVQVTVNLFGDHIQNLVVRDENGDPLDHHLTGSQILVDSIGATELHFTYYTESLVKTESGLTYVKVNTPETVGIMLPDGANFFDMSHIPIQISEFNGASYLRFDPGEIYVYYLIGLPKLQQESAASINKAENYLLSKQMEGYYLEGAKDLLSQATAEYSKREYYRSKTLADDALKIAVLTVESADDALSSINSMKLLLNTEENEASTDQITEAFELLSFAQEQFDRGAYVDASLTLIEISKLDLSHNTTGAVTIFNQSIPLIILLGLCSIVYLLENNDSISISQLIGGGISE